MIQITLLSESRIHWPALLKNTMEVLGRSITRQLDSERLPVDNYRSFIVCLSDILSPNIKSTEAMRTANEVLSHLHFSFLIWCDYPDVFLDIISRAEIRIVRNEDMAIVSGTLREWKLSIESYLKRPATPDATLFYDKLVLYFETLGLSELFIGKKPQADGTFLLEG